MTEAKHSHCSSPTSSLVDPNIFAPFLLDILENNISFDATSVHIHHSHKVNIDRRNSINIAIELCLKCVSIFRNMPLDAPNTTTTTTSDNKQAKVVATSLIRLNADTVSSICSFLGVVEKARFRFVSRFIHKSMMGCSLDLVEVLNISKNTSTRELIHKFCPFKLMKKQIECGCNCDAYHQLELIDNTTATISTDALHKYSLFQLKQLNVDRSWTISGIKLEKKTSIDDFVSICDVLSNNKGYHSLKRIRILLDRNLDLIENMFTPVEQTSSSSSSSSSTMLTCSLSSSTMSTCSLSPALIHILTSIESVEVYGCSSNYIIVKPEVVTHIFQLKTLTKVFFDTINFGDIALSSFVQFASIQQLTELTLIQTRLNVQLEDIAKLTNLTKLRLTTDNSNSSTMWLCGDVNCLTALSRLTFLQMKSFDVVGDIHFLKSLTKLEVVLLQCSELFGDAGDCITTLKSLEEIILHGVTFLKGNITNALCQVKDRLRYVYFNNSLCEGHSSCLGALSGLLSLELESIPLICGDLSALSSLTSLTVLRISLDRPFGMTGNISFVENLRCLEDCSIIGSTEFVFGFLDSFSNLFELKILTLTDSSFSGNISSFSLLSKLEVLTLEYCDLIVGDLDSLSTLSHLEVLVLFGTVGVIGSPDSLRNKLQKLTTLDLPV
jgi:hypothetical protein